MRNIILGAMDLTLTIERPANATGSWLETHETFTTIASGVKCMLGDVTQQVMNQQQPGPIGEQLMWEVFVPLGTNVQENDRVTFSNGQVLRVQSVNTPRSVYFGLTNFLAGTVR